MSKISHFQTQASSSLAPPDDLRKELAQLDWRLRWISFVKGSSKILFVTLVLAAFFLVTDFFFPVPGLIRFGFLSGLTILLAWMVARWLFIPLLRKRHWAELAFLIDRSFPALQERVSSTVELSMQSDQQFNSEFMLNRLRRETDKRLSGVDLWDCISLNSMAIALGAGIIISLVLASPLLFNAGGYSLLWQRLLTPWANLDSATNLTFELEQGDRTVPRGDDVFIVAKPVWRYREGEIPREINLSWTNQRGESKSREMSYDQRKGAYIGKIPQVLSPLTYYLYGSGARSRNYSIHVADRPRLIDVQLTIEPPSYTGIDAITNEGAIGTIRAIQGSLLIAEITFEHPVREIQWRWHTLRDHVETSVTGNSSVPTKSDADDPESSSIVSKFPKTHLQGILSPDGLSARIEARAEMSDSFVFRAISFDDLENINEPERTIQIIPDRPPRIDISGDKNPIKVRLDDVIPIHLTAEDDFGVQEVQLIVEHLSAGLENPELLAWNSDKTGEAVREVYDSHNLDLSQFDLKDGDILGYRAVARDGRPVPEPNETWTSRRVLIINKDVASLAGQLVEEYYDRMRRQVDAVKSEMTQFRRTVEAQRRELDPKPRDQVAETIQEKRPEWLQNELALSLKLEELARNLRQRPITSELSKQNADPARKILDDASEELASFKETASPNPVEVVRNHEKSLRDAENLLNRLRNQLDDAERIEQELVQLQHLARRARKLAKSAAQLGEPQQNDQPQSDPSSQPQSNSPPGNNTAANADAEPAADEPKQASASEPPEQPETTPLEELQQEHAALSQDLDALLKRRPELMQAAKNALLSELAEVSEKAQELAKQQESLTEGVRESRREILEDQQHIASALTETEEIAEELAARSEKESAKNAAPVFDAAPAKKAVQQQKQANISNAKQAVDQAQEALSRFTESQKTASSLPADLQQATKQLTEKTEQLAKKMQAHQKQHQDLVKQAQAQKKDESTQKDLAEKTEQDQKIQQQIAEELAGLTQAIDALKIPFGLNKKQQEALKQIEQAGQEFAKQSPQAASRLQGTARALKTLANQIDTPEKRSQKTEALLNSLKKEADKLAIQIQENVSKGALSDPEALKDLAEKQLALAKRLMRADVLDQEQQLAQTVQSAIKAHKQLQARQGKQAAASEKEFAEQLDQLKQAVQQAGKKQETEQKKAATEENTETNAWKNANVPEEIKQIRFPKQRATSEEVKKALDQIAQAQKQLAEKTEKIISEHSNPEQAKTQKNNLRTLSAQQKKMAELTANIPGGKALLPRMKAARALHEASKALHEGDAEQSQHLQQEAAAQLELAQKLIKKETGKPQADPVSSPSTADLAKTLEEKLKALDQELAQSLTKTAKSDQPSQPSDAEQSKTSSEQKLAQAIEQLQQSQELVAEQSKQLAQQSQLEQPDREKQNLAMQQAAESAEQIHQKLQSGQFNQAAKQAQQVSEQLQQASQEESPDERARAAMKQLAEKQAQLAQQLAELAKNRQASRIAREKSQASLNQQTDALTEKLNEIAKHSQADPISDRQTGQKTEALSEHSAQAAERMQQSINQSQKANLEQTEKQSQNAARKLQTLAEQSALIAQMKRDTLVPEPVGEEASEASRMLDQAGKSLKQAIEQAQQQRDNEESTDSPAASKKSPSQASKKNDSKSSSSEQTPPEQQNADSQQQSDQDSSDQPPSAAQQLAEQLAQAAKALEQANQNLQPSQKESSKKSKKSQKQTGKGKPSDQPPDSETGNQTELTGDGEMTGDIIRSALMRDWGQKQGKLEANLTDGRRRHIDQEYAPLIRRYFEALAQPEPPEKNPDPEK